VDSKLMRELREPTTLEDYKKLYVEYKSRTEELQRAMSTLRSKITELEKDL